jgi:hypothetical protein
MAVHLRRKARGNSLHMYLDDRGLDLEGCAFRLIAHGPIREERGARTHKASRDIVAAMECRLASDMHEVGYDVLNDVTSNARLSVDLWRPVRAAFAKEFRRLKR